MPTGTPKSLTDHQIKQVQGICAARISLVDRALIARLESLERDNVHSKDCQDVQRARIDELEAFILTLDQINKRISYENERMNKLEDRVFDIEDKLQVLLARCNRLGYQVLIKLAERVEALEGDAPDYINSVNERIGDLECRFNSHLHAIKKMVRYIEATCIEGVR